MFKEDELMQTGSGEAYATPTAHSCVSSFSRFKAENLVTNSLLILMDLNYEGLKLLS